MNFTPIRILHISDLHFGPSFVPKTAHALKVFAQESAHDLLVISGDLTQRAKLQQFREARAYIDSLPGKEKLIVPGNHDVPLYRFFERALCPYRNYKKIISEKLDTVVRLPQAVVVGLNSTAPYTRIVNGAITAEQLALCIAALESGQAGIARIVVMHHHLVPTPDFEKSEHIANARPILSHLSRLGVDLVLGGHAHRSYVGSSLDTYPAREPEKGIVIVQCGTSTSRRGRGRERDRNSFNLIEINEHTIHVTHYLYFEAASKFLPAAEYRFPRPASIHL